MKKFAFPVAAFSAVSTRRPAAAATRQNRPGHRRRILAALLAATSVAVGLLSLTPAAQAQTFIWKTLAGMPGGQGAVDGTGSAARFYSPYAAAVDSNGNVYVADRFVDTIRKITPSGVVTTLAGKAGFSGSTDGTGSAARFNEASGVAVDGSGNVYVADTLNNTIRKVTPAGVVTTLAGSAGTSGSTDGTGSAARFNSPDSVAVDGNGNVYVADTSNHTIRKVTPAGVVTTFAGSAGMSGSADGTGSAARFNFPGGVAVDGNGNLYVSDTNNDTLRKITPAGVVTTLAGSPGVNGNADGTGSAAQFDFPSPPAVDANGNIYLMSDDTLRKVTPAGVVTTLAGSSGMFGSADGTGSAARFFNPGGVGVDHNGNIYVADNANFDIRKVTPAGVVTTFAGSAGFFGSTDATGTAARFDGPEAAAVDSNGNVYVADTFNDTIRKITPAGVVTTLAGSPGNPGSADGTGSAARFDQPQGIAVDTSGNVYVADFNNFTIRKITPGGAVTTLAGSAGISDYVDGTGSAARFSNPWGIAVDSNGNVYVGDSNNEVIRKITPGGVVTTLAGDGTANYKDGTGTAAEFNTPAGVAVDKNGNVFVADADNGVIRKITPAGVVTTLAGNPGFSGSTDGTGSAARFNFPEGVAVDSNGNVYVADTFNNTIRRVTSAGVVTTIGGQPSGLNGGGSDGLGTAALFSMPNGIAATPGGRVFVADTNNNRIEEGTTNTVDFNGDGMPDYLLFNAGTLQTAIWYLNGPTHTSSAYGPTLPSGWAVVGVADFNGDGKPDLVLFNAGTLQTAIWYMNGPTHTSSAFGPTLPSGWTVVGVADLNGDGMPDFLLFNAGTLQTALWYLNGPTHTSSAFGPTLPSGWTVARVADFNNDGKPDFVLFNAGTLQTAIWYMNGPTHVSSAFGPTLPSGWVLAGVADFNTDGQTDFVLFNAGTLQTALWYLNGPTHVSSAFGPTLPSGWQLVPAPGSGGGGMN